MPICVCRRLIMIYLLLIALAAQAESNFFSNLSIRDGLPSNIIASIAQDKYDFLWIGTGSGLARYDGYNFKIFKKDESINSISNNGITTLLALDNYIWIGTWTGLCKINTETFKVTRIELGENSAIRTLFKGKDNVLWVGTNDGLIRYEMDTGESKTYNSNNSGLSHNTIRAIYEDSAGNLFVGTFDKLNKLKFGEDRFEVVNLEGTEHQSPAHNLLILDIKPKGTTDQALWIGTDYGLYSLNSKSGQIEHFSKEETGFSNHVIKCIYTDANSNLWLGTDFGLNIFHPDQMTVDQSFHNPQQPYSIPSNVIWQILKDRSGVLWLATSNGLSRINSGGNFYEYHDVSYSVENQLIGNQVKSVLVSSKGIYWLGTLHGVIRIDSKSGNRRFFDFSSNTGNNVFSLEEDQYGRIWIGTAGGINIWDNNEQKMYPISASDSNGLTSNYIGKLLSTTDGSFWVSEWEGGLYKVDALDKKPDEFNFIPVKGLESGSEKIVYGKGSIWVVEFDELYRVGPEDYTKIHIESFSKASGKQMIYSIYFSRSGHLWAGTLNGLIQYIPDENKSIFHPLVTGSDVIISSIIEDRDGNIWSISNTSVVYKFYPDTNNIEIYPLDKDLPLKSFYYGCVAITVDNKIIFGGDNGYITFSPENVKPNLYNSNIYITAVEINNQLISVNDTLNGKVVLQKDVAFTDHIVLDYDQRSLSFEFSSLHYWQPSINVFSYRLEGLENEWNHVSGSKNFAVYSNLPAGEYQFQVKGTNNYGISSDQMANLAITINPPLLFRKGFIALYFIIGALIVFYTLRFYSARVHLKNELRIIKMEKEHSEEIERTKEEFFTNISHELRTPISLILPPIHEIQKRGGLDNLSKHLITLAEKNSIRLLRLVNQILDFNKLGVEVLQLKVSEVEMVSFCKDIFLLFEDQAKRNGITYVMENKVERQKAWVDAEKLETVLFNLLSNAFKFTPRGGRIEMHLFLNEMSSEHNEELFQIMVKDSGEGIPKEDQNRIFERFYQAPNARKKESGSGIGLTIVAEYVELHHGFIQLESEVGRGTDITISLPLGKSHLPVDSIEKGTQIKLLAKPSLYGEQDGSRFYQLKPESDKPLVLLIDDNIDMIDFIRTSLGHKYNFVLAQDGQEGIKKANNFNPHIIVSDIMMPVMDGLELCRKVKENPKTTHISIIFISAKSMTENRVEGMRMGADAYIVKPFEIELLEAQIDTLIQRQKELREYFRNDLIRLPIQSNSSNNEDNKFVKRVMDLIEANISNSELTVEMIAGEMAMSSTHLYRRLKAITDHSAKEIIQKYRLKKASQLLNNKEGNITEVMYRVGFTNLSYFSRCFKAEYQVSPKQYQEIVNS